MRQINQAGFDLIKQYEGLSLKAYLCPAKVYTIGYGHTGPEVNNNTRYTQERADLVLEDDILKFCRIVTDIVKVPINNNQFSALVCLAFNIGGQAFSSSTLVKLLNAGDIKSASAQFLRWNRVNGKILEGLTRRRQSEKDLFNES